MFKKIKKQKTLCFSSADINEVYLMLLLYRFAMLLQTSYRIFKLVISLLLLFMIFIATQISSLLNFTYHIILPQLLDTSYLVYIL